MNKWYTTILCIGILFFSLAWIIFFAEKGNVQESASFQKREESALPLENESLRASIVFTGDIMLDRYIRTVARKIGYTSLLEDNKNILKESDAVVINLEGPITNNPSRSEASVIGSHDNYFFTFDPESITFLLKHNMRIVHLGNNHIDNFGPEGVRQTQNYLEQHSLEYFGSSNTLPEKIVLRKTLQGIKFSFVSYNQFSSISGEHIALVIKKEKEMSDFVVVYTHWGQEYKTISDQKQKNLAHNFIDAGADAVIGSHPHVIQEKEVYKGKTIYYSLGNFIFDQYFDALVKKGLVVRATFDKEENSIQFEDFSAHIDSKGVTKL
ncbi:MAG: CapA family protein [Candidatus Moranbacteria bacterium]|nr:CapA family protein [Candidatus Moranbacteria bacterium]